MADGFFKGIQGSGKAGPAEAEVKAGFTASTADGVSLKATAHGSVGSASGRRVADPFHTTSDFPGWPILPILPQGRVGLWVTLNS